MTDKRVFEATVVEVFSGDDIIAMVDLEVEDLHKRQRIRLAGVDTPNGIGNGSDTEAGKIRRYVRGKLHGKKVRLTVTQKRSTNWIAIVEVIEQSGEVTNINDDLIAQGFAFEGRKA